MKLKMSLVLATVSWVFLTIAILFDFSDTTKTLSAIFHCQWMIIYIIHDTRRSK